MENNNVNVIVKETLEIAETLQPTDTMFIWGRVDVSTEQVVIKENVSYPTRVIMCDMGGQVGAVSSMVSLGYELVSDVITETSIYEAISGDSAPQLDYALFKSSENEVVLVATINGNMVKMETQETVKSVVNCVNEKMVTIKPTELGTTPLIDYTTGVNKVVLINDEFKLHKVVVDFYIVQGNEHPNSVNGIETTALKYFNECSEIGTVITPFNFPGTGNRTYQRVMVLERPEGGYVLLME